MRRFFTSHEREARKENCKVYGGSGSEAMIMVELLAEYLLSGGEKMPRARAKQLWCCRMDAGGTLFATRRSANTFGF
jgi:hypothetical protein